MGRSSSITATVAGATPGARIVHYVLAGSRGEAVSAGSAAGPVLAVERVG